MGDTIAADIPDIKENLEELRAAIENFTNGTFGSTEASAFTVSSITDGSTGFASATCQPFYQNSAPTGWTRKADLQETSMFTYAASGNPGTGGGVDATATHTHTGPSHTHTGPNHTHTGPSHTHTGPSHTHKLPIGNPSGVPQNYAYDNTKFSGTFSATTQINGNGGGAVTAQQLVSEAGGTGNTGADGTGATGAAGTGATGASGTAATGANTAPYYIEMILATVD
jgi:hypothetical protein